VADPLLRKLHHKGGVPVVVLWPPDEVEPALARWGDEGVAVRRRAQGRVPFVLAFVRSRQEVAERAGKVVSLLDGDDAVLWFAYPKKSSKRYRTDLERDHSWGPVGDLGFEPVSQVAVDDDWSALRFRRTEHVKSFTRGGAISAEGKRRLARRPPPT
jgi:hypothetical protein